METKEEREVPLSNQREADGACNRGRQMTKETREMEGNTEELRRLLSRVYERDRN